MRCPHCEFENMPGAAVCFRCSAALDADQVTVDIHPPRASAGRKHWRAFRRRVKETTGVRLRYGARKGRAAMEPDTLKKVFMWLLLSPIPGLSHLLQHRFGEVVWLVIAWLVLLLSGLFLHGTLWGAFLLGLAGTLHAWIALHAGNMIPVGRGFRKRLAELLVACLYIMACYILVGRLAGLVIVGAAAQVTLPLQEVLPGDYYLGRRIRPVPRDVERGALLIVSVPTRIVGHGRNIGRRHRTAGQVVGMPGEYVQIRDGRFAVNGTTLDPESYPVPEWFIGIAFYTRLSADEYCLSLDYHAQGRPDRDMVRSALVIQQDDILARASVRWTPVMRRGWMRPIE